MCPHQGHSDSSPEPSDMCPHDPDDPGNFLRSRRGTRARPARAGSDQLRQHHHCRQDRSRPKARWQTRQGHPSGTGSGTALLAGHHLLIEPFDPRLTRARQPPKTPITTALSATTPSSKSRELAAGDRQSGLFHVASQPVVDSPPVNIPEFHHAHAPRGPPQGNIAKDRKGLGTVSGKEVAHTMTYRVVFTKEDKEWTVVAPRS